MLIMNHKWQRVSRSRQCQICGKGDWCLIAIDGTAAICARVESEWIVGDRGAGWLHKLGGKHNAAPFRLSPTEKAPKFTSAELVAITDRCIADISDRRIRLLGKSLGVTVESLRRLRCGWDIDNESFTFPMSDAQWNTIGIRLRLVNGRKLALRGSRQGLFVPMGIRQDRALLIAEGTSDCAALLDLSFNAIGRPSCRGGTRFVVEYVRRLGFRHVIVVADQDEPGRHGADSLVSTLIEYVVKVWTVTPPNGAGDIREWVNTGGTREELITHMKSAVGAIVTT